jgi:hypothetical protein
VVKTPRFRLALLFFLQPLSSALWILPFGNILASRGWEWMVPVVFAFPSFAALFAPLLAAVVADHKLASQTVLRYALLGSAVMMFLAAAAVEAGSQSAVLACMAGHAILFAPTGTLATAIVLANSENPSRDFPFFRLWSTISYIAAGYLISFVMTADFSPTAMVAGAVAETLLAVFTLFLPKAPAPNLSLRGGGWKRLLGIDAVLHFPGGQAAALLVLLTTTMCFSAAFFPYAPQLLSAKGFDRPSAWMTIGQWSEIVFIGLLPILLGKVQARWLMVAGLACSAIRCVGFTAFAASGQWPMVAFALAMHGPVTAFTFVTMQVFMEKNLPLEVRNRSQALVSLFGSGLGPLTGLVVAGFLAARTIVPSGGNADSWMFFWAILSLLQFVALGVFCLKLARRDPIAKC